jgi:hypothetical protein
MNPELARVFLLGMIDRSSPTFDIAMKYIRNVAFIEDSKSLHYSYVLDEVPHHRNYVLYHALRCEL